MKKYAVLILLFALLTVAPATFAAEKKKNSADTFRLLHLFGDVFEQVRSKYVESPTDQELIEAAISGMLTSLDPHSSYLSAKNFREMQVQTRGEFGGLGIEVTMDKGLVKVVSPIDDTPAHKAGIEPGDLISHLDGKPITGMTLSQAVEKMRGKVGSDIILTVRRGAKKSFDVTVTRAVINQN
jgi:carboxyl-terminal processing protease